jgi:glycosyltransferase involved in cell wall biosynthesis
MKEKIKTLQIIPSLGYGGGQYLVVNIAKYINKEKYDVRVISLFGPLNTELERILENENIFVYYLGKKKGLDFKMFYKIYKILKLYKPQIIHTHLSVLRYVLPSILINRKIIVIHTVHNIAEKEVDNVGKFIHKIAFSIRGVIPVSISEFVKTSIVRIYGIENIPTILNGIPVKYYQNAVINRDDWRKKEGFEKEDFIFVNIARLQKQKNQALLIEAFAEGPAKFDNCKLIIVGNGYEYNNLEKLVKLYKLSNKVFFLGIRTDIPDILNASDVFVLSSDWEGVPLSVLEAMAAGKPVVATAVGGIPELIKDKVTGILVNPGDKKALSKSMMTLFENKSLCQVLGNNAKNFAEKEFDIKVMIKKYEHLYEDLLNKCT